MFDNVNEVEFHAKEYDKILTCISQEGEKLPVSNNIIMVTFDMSNLGWQHYSVKGHYERQREKFMAGF